MWVMLEQSSKTYQRSKLMYLFLCSGSFYFIILKQFWKEKPQHLEWLRTCTSCCRSKGDREQKRCQVVRLQLVLVLDPVMGNMFLSVWFHYFHSNHPQSETRLCTAGHLTVDILGGIINNHYVIWDLKKIQEICKYWIWNDVKLWQTVNYRDWRQNSAQRAFMTLLSCGYLGKLYPKSLMKIPASSLK